MRPVTVDELITLAVVLDVPVGYLLAPDGHDEYETPEGGTVTAEALTRALGRPGSRAHQAQALALRLRDLDEQRRFVEHEYRLAAERLIETAISLAAGDRP